MAELIPSRLLLVDPLVAVVGVHERDALLDQAPHVGRASGRGHLPHTSVRSLSFSRQAEERVARSPTGILVAALTTTSQPSNIAVSRCWSKMSPGKAVAPRSPIAAAPLRGTRQRDDVVACGHHRPDCRGADNPRGTYNRDLIEAYSS